MASVYTNDLRLEEIGSGEQSGTWGDTTNTNLELIAEAFSFGTEAITTNADTHATTIADGATDAGRSMFLKYTGTLDSACTITIGPNTVSKLWFIENGTSGSQNIIIKQGSGATITISAGQTKAIYSNGAGSGAAMVDAFASLSVVDLIVSDDLVVGDDLGVTGLVTIGETLAVTGVLTTTAATVFNGGFASNAASTISTADNLDTLSLISTDADANSGPNLRLYRNSANPADDDFLGTIEFEGRNDNSQDFVATKFFSYATDVSDGSEDAAFQLQMMKAGSIHLAAEITPTEFVINQSSVDIDFRVETNAQASAFVIDAADDTITTTNQVVTITHGGNGKQLELISTDADANSGPQLDFYRNSASPADNDQTGRIIFAAENDADEKTEYTRILTYMPDVSNGSEDAAIQYYLLKDGTSIQRLEHSPTETVFNQDSADVDFRVESNGNANMLFVDGGNDAVMIGASAAGYPAFADNLTVADTANAGITIRSGTGNQGNIYFSDATGTGGGTYVGYVSYNHATNKMVFQAGGAVALTLATAGAATIANGLTLTDGNLVVASGHGIDFAATSDGNGADTSELFNDYEEGTWTPTLPNGGSLTKNEARYTKVGRLVHAYCYIQITPTNNTSSFFVAGLPYPVKNINHYYGGGDGPSYSAGLNTTTWGSPLQHYGQSYVYWHDVNGGGNVILNNFFSGNSYPLIFNVTYFV